MPSLAPDPSPNCTSRLAAKWRNLDRADRARLLGWTGCEPLRAEALSIIENLLLFPAVRREAIERVMRDEQPLAVPV